MWNRIREWLLPLVLLANNWISLSGVVLVTTATVFWLFLLPASLAADRHPYLGILTFLLLPGAFFAGLGLIPVGISRLRKRGVVPADYRRLAAFFLSATFLNLVLASTFTYQAVAYMDSTGFCGLTCHKVMKPEYTAYQNSAHSRVSCVECHIGEGASWFVKSKLSGIWQVVAVTLNTYERPIATPIPNLRPARETCQECHWPQKYGEDRVRVNAHFAEDEANTRTKNVLLLRIGGGPSGPGIHGAHLGEGVVIRYRAKDAKRQEIPWVEFSRNGKAVNTFLAEGAKAAGVEPMAVREMDCMDCHNRPSHSFEAPEVAMDRAMADGAIPASLPWAKKRGLELLKARYGSNEEARQKILAAWASYYGAGQEASRAAERLLAIYERNIFPEMNIGWGTYPNHIGHNASPGCFRCHDERKSASGKTLTQDCNTCHSLLAMDEAEPKILSDLGIAGAGQ